MRTGPLEAVESPFPTARRAWAVVAILAVVTLFSLLDRQLPALLVKPLKARLDISDTQFSLLQGYAFALVYTTLGLPFGRLVDRANRRNLIIIGVLIWSGMTIASAFADNFAYLVVARMGVGVGEAVLAPAAYSIIADIIAPERRGRALSLYYTSLTIGGGASLLIGGIVLRLLPPEGLSILGSRPFEPWQMLFLLAGLPGLPLALLMLAVREPVRREVRGGPRPSVGAFIAHLVRYRATFLRLLTYPALLAVVGYSVFGWAPTFFNRQYGVPVATAGVVLGIVLAASGVSGTLLSGMLSDRWLRARTPAARFRVTLIAWALVVPCASLWPLSPTPVLAYALVAVTIVGVSIGQAAAPASIQDVVPNGMRGQAIALYLLIGGLVGIGFAPTAVALLTDHVFGSEGKLGYSLAAVALPSSLLGAWLCVTGQRAYAATYRSMHEIPDRESEAASL